MKPDPVQRQRQEEELEVIKAIYLEEVKDVQVNKDHIKVSIQLGPQRGGGSSEAGQPRHQLTSVLLCLTIPSNYPISAPKVSLNAVKGISSDEVTELKEGLDNLARSNVGEEMILNLAQFTQDFLFQHQKRPTGSFYDEMLMRNQLQEEKTKKKEKEFQEQEVLGIKYEIERKKELLKEEVRSRKEELKMYSETKTESLPSTRLGSPSREFLKEQFEAAGRTQISRRSSSLRRSECADDPTNASSDVMKIEFIVGKYTRTFHRGKLLSANESGHRVYAGMDSHTGNLVIISEWSLNFSSGKIKLSPADLENYEDVSRQMNSMESEMRLFQKLQHPNIVTYIGVTILKTTPKITVHIAHDFIQGITLASYLEGNLRMDISLIRHCTLGIVNALSYLHSNNVVHRYLRDKSIFVNAEGEVKVGEYGLERKLEELQRSVNGSEVVSDQFAPSIGRGAKKGDVYRVGILILSLLKGQRITENPPEFPRSLSPEIQDFVKKCIDTNENARWTADQLLDHAFLKLPLQQRKDLLSLKDHNDDHENQEDNGHHNEEMQYFLSHAVKGHSRLREEFEIELWLGKGGFGDVLQVRNKLDGGIYALKRIRLNPKNKLLNKKITREVKLLSRLNHENVVRYYNSWIETVLDSVDESDVTTSPSKATTTATSSKVKFKDNIGNIQNSLGIQDNIEDQAPQLISRNSEWGSSVGGGDFIEEDSEESSDEEDLFGTSFLCLNDVSEDVVFGSSPTNSSTPSEANKSSTEVSNNSKQGEFHRHQFGFDTKDGSVEREAQFMYIQMEFCEKSTLRTAIDAGLYEDMERAWRLFREIVEGLAHIHQQGMIHRDLKPVNIFLDSNDHVKIGDFGLATTSIMVRNSAELMTVHTPVPYMHADFSVEESLTSNIGTALYVAPELVSKSFQGSKIMYSQKVDIYSLGIVFFEMVYHPIDTGMERVRVITGIRQKEVLFPSDFDTILMARQAVLLKWLLNHEPGSRPTSQELLQSEYLPPPQMEEAELHEMFRHTLSNSQSKVYKNLISSCFQQNVSAAEEITYDMDILRSQLDPHLHSQANVLSVIQYVKTSIKRICMKHGSVEVNTPMLLPKLPMYENTSSQVRLMTHSGSIVNLHHDLRVPFARYVVANGLTNIKRHAIEKVFRERKVFGFHPREFYECAFDIVSSAQGSLLAEAETLSVAFEIFQDLPWMREKNFTVRLGHTYLLDAVLIHFSIPESVHSEIKAILTDIKDEKQAKSQVQTRLVSLCLPDQFISLLFTLMDIQGPLPKVSNILKSIMKRNGIAASRIKEGLHELQILTELIESFGLQCDIVVSPTMIFGSNIYSGLLYQITCQMKKKRNKITMDVIAVGGKYDELLRSLRSTREIAGITPTRELEQCGVGISISLDLLIAGAHEMKEIARYGLVDVIVCSLGHHLRTKEKIGMLKNFWSHGIACTGLDGSQSLETAEEQCVELGASFIVLLKEESFNSTLRVRYLEKQRFLEKKIPTAEVVDFILSRLTYSASTSQPLRTESVQRAAVQPSESGSIHTQGSSVPGINVSFVITESKDKPANWKRRQESMMIGHISEALRKLSKQQVVEVLGVEVSSDCVKILCSDLDITDKDQFNKSVSEILERHPRQKKTLKGICDEIYELIFIRNSEITVIYSLLDNFYKTLV